MYSLKNHILLSVFLVILALFVTGLGAVFFLHRAIGMSDAIVEGSFAELRLNRALQASLARVAMPPNDYLIHGNLDEREKYHALAVRIERQFAEMAGSTHMVTVHGDALAAARREWRAAQAAAAAIFSMPEPLGNALAAAKMEVFDTHLERAIEAVETINTVTEAEITARDAALHGLSDRASIFIIVALLGGIVLAILGSVTVVRAFLPPLRTLNEGMLRFSKGEFGYRLAQRMPAEFQQLSEGFNTMASSLQETHIKLERESTHDAMTGCYNHRKFIHDLKFEVSRTKRYRHPVSLLMFDLDHFKAINDTHGHPAGDAVLRAVAREIQGQLRESDALYRYGGEEFAVILLETDGQCARLVAERMRATIENMAVPIADDVTLRATVSIGIGGFPDDAGDASTLVKIADQALYRAKASGRNCVCHARDNCVPLVAES